METGGRTAPVFDLLGGYLATDQPQIHSALAIDQPSEAFGDMEGERSLYLGQPNVTDSGTTVTSTASSSSSPPP